MPVLDDRSQANLERGVGPALVSRPPQQAVWESVRAWPLFEPRGNESDGVESPYELPRNENGEDGQPFGQYELPGPWWLGPERNFGLRLQRPIGVTRPQASPNASRSAG